METIYNLPEPWLVFGKEYKDFFVQTATLLRTAKDLDNEDEGGSFRCFPIDEKGVVHDEEISYAGATEQNYIHIVKKGKPINGCSAQFIKTLVYNAESDIADSLTELKEFIETNDSELYFGTKEGDTLFLNFTLKEGYIEDCTNIDFIKDRNIVFHPMELDETTPECIAKTLLKILNWYFELFPELTGNTIEISNHYSLSEDLKEKVFDILLEKRIYHNYDIIVSKK